MKASSRLALAALQRCDGGRAPCDVVHRLLRRYRLPSCRSLVGSRSRPSSSARAMGALRPLAWHPGLSTRPLTEAHPQLLSVASQPTRARTPMLPSRLRTHQRPPRGARKPRAHLGMLVRL
jgi:hypothetical protein